MPRPHRRARLTVHELEPRAVPTVFVVTSAADTVAVDGVLTLREAITAANTNAPAGDAPAGSPGLDAIGFAIGAGPVTISPASPLPAITEAVTLDGTSQPGFAGKPLVVLNGTAAGATAGLTLTGHTGSTVRGLVINGFQNEGILVIGGGKHEIVGNYIGTDAAGTTAVANKNGGVALTAGTTNSVVDGNLMSGNGLVTFRPFLGSIYSGPAVLITGAGTTGNQIAGNLVGTDVTGTVALPNLYISVFIANGASGNVIGGTTAAERNVISGNGFADIQVGDQTGASPADTRIVGNYIDTNAAGSAPIFGKGVQIISAINTHVGEPGAGNLIGPGGITQAPAAGGVTGTLIQGNRIGTTADGSAGIGLPPTLFSQGMSIGGDALIGGTAPGEGNQVSGNYYGIIAGGEFVRIEGNLIGTDSTGMKAIPNVITGVLVNAGATVGGADPAAANVISGNTGSGVVLAGGAILQGNLIGVAKDGVTPLGNGGGVAVTGAKNLIGGTNPGEGNVIAHNAGPGVFIQGDQLIDPAGNTLVGNRILGNAIFDNAGYGIDLAPAGVNPNDPGDTDLGPNGSQNRPVLSTALAGPTTTVSGVLASKAGTQYRIEFFAVATPDAGGFGEGDVYLGFMNVTTIINPDGTGTATFTANGLNALPAGFTHVTATATDLTTGDTSEFSQAVTAIPTAVRVFQAGGPADGTTQVLSQVNGALVAGATQTFFPGAGVNVRTATADLTGDGVPDYIGGTGPGVATRVVILDGATGATVASFRPFEASFTGGVFVAAADFDRDGHSEVVVTPDLGGGPVVAIFDGAQLAAGKNEAAERRRFLGIDDPAFRGGARAAAGGDLDSDGVPDLVVAAGFGGGPRVALFGGTGLAAGATLSRLLPDFFAFEDTLRNGAFVAVRDVTGDGVADFAFGGGPGGAPRVRLFDGKALVAAPPFSTLDAAPWAQLANFFAGDPSLRGGVRVALVTVDGDSRADLVAGSGEGEPARVRVYEAPALLAGPTAPDRELDLFGGAALPNGVFVG